MSRRIWIITVLVVLTHNDILAQDDTPWWKRLFKKETVDEIEKENPENSGDNTKDSLKIDSTQFTDPVKEETAIDSSEFQFGTLIKQDIPGNVVVHNDYPLDSLNEIYSERTNYGYRIQVYFGDLDIAKSTRAEFIQKRTPFNCYIELKAPNYAVLVGDYRDLFEAHQNLFKIRKDYPDALIVESVIEP